MNALVTGNPIAIHSRNPVRVRDNPLPLPTKANDDLSASRKSLKRLVELIGLEPTTS